MIVGFANRTLDWNLGLFLGLARLFNFLETVNVFWSSAGVGTRVIGPLILFKVRFVATQLLLVKKIKLRV